MPPLPEPRKSLKLNKEASKISLSGFSFTTADCLVYLPKLKGQLFHVTHDESNWLRGVRKRVAHIENPIDTDLRNEYFDFVRTKILPRIPILPANLDERYLLDEWLSHSNYNQKRQNVLRQKYEEFERGMKPSRFLACKSFIKAEFYQSMKEPRIINSRSDWFKAKVGGYIHAMESLVYDEHFIKHKPPLEVARIMKDIADGFSYFYETDYSSFEGTFYQDLMMNVELRLFQHCLHNYPNIVSLITRCYTSKNVIVFKNKYVASFKGSRMSGDMWTSMANGFTNKTIVEFMLYKAQSDGNYLVEGDDGYICSAKPLDVTIPNSLGFSLKCEAKEDFNDVSFCSLHQHENLLVPDVNRILRNYGAVIDFQLVNAFKRSNESKRARKLLRDYAKSKAYSLLSRCRGVPILQSMALQQIDFFKDAHVRRQFCDYWSNTMFSLDVDISPIQITKSMREYVDKNFGISPDVQSRVEKEISEMRTSSYYISM